MASLLAPSAASVQLPQPPPAPEIIEADRTPLNPGAAGGHVSPGREAINSMIGKALSSTTSLSQLLPTGTVLAFQSLATSFTNEGSCYPANKGLTWALIGTCAMSCAFFNFTDSVQVVNGNERKTYYGVATWNGFWMFNYQGNSEVVLGNPKRYRMRPVDFIHAFFAVMLFAAVAFSEVSVRKCLFPDKGQNVKQLLLNMPLGAALLSTIVFLVFPTSRKGIGYTGMARSAQ